MLYQKSSLVEILTHTSIYASHGYLKNEEEPNNKMKALESLQCYTLSFRH